MTQEQFKYLCSEEGREVVAKYIDLSPSVVALKGVGAAVATQIKYLQRAKTKIEPYYNVKCIIPPLQYEQCSSWQSAKAKEFKADTIIDLTCGLGVDSFAFSCNFKRVISIERDPFLCELAQYNFGLLGAENIEVINSSAADFIANYSGEMVDYIYVDPARRDEEKKVFLLEDCSPNMVDIMDRASQICQKVVVKLSPLFDVDMVYKLFSKYGDVVARVVSLNGECKETIAIVDTTKVAEDIDIEAKSRKIEVVVLDKSSEKRFSFNYSKNGAKSGGRNCENFSYLYIPDVAFYKGRCVNQLFSKFYQTSDFLFESDNSAIFSNQKIEDFAGSSYKIEHIMPYKPKELKKWFKKEGQKINIIKKDFATPTEKIKKELNVSDGNMLTALFTTLKGEKVVAILQRL